MQAVEPVLYHLFTNAALVRRTPVRSLFKVFRLTQRAFAPVGRLSEGWIFMQLEDGSFCNCSCQSSSFSSFCVDVSGWTCVRKLFLELRLVTAGDFPYQEYLSSHICFRLSDCLATPLLMSGGAIPASRCSFLVLVGFKHLVMRRMYG